MTTATAPTVVVQVERRRGCGYRKPSKGGKGVGIYLVGGALSAPCGRLPFPLHRCPCCSGGIKPCRGWTWIDPRALFGVPEQPCTGSGCGTCPLGAALPEGRHGLLWIGESFYPSPHDFLAEAKSMGVSRKIGALPRGFELGKTVVYLAHRFAVPAAMPGEEATPGVFWVFTPTGVDLVIEAGESVPERAVRLAEQIGEGARIVQVIPDEETQATLGFVDAVAQGEP